MWCGVRILLILVLSACAAAAIGCKESTVAGGEADGPQIYSELCARCHGPEGVPNASMVARTGVKPLTSERVQEELSVAEIRDQIENGSDNKQMPAFEGALNDEQIDAVVEHVRSLDGP